MGTTDSRVAGQMELALANFLNNVLPSQYFDVAIDESLLRYSGTNSTDSLMEYYGDLQLEVKGLEGPFYNTLAKSLRGSSEVANAAGLGALVIAMILQVVFAAVKVLPGSNVASPMDISPCVLADEKTSGVLDPIQEYLKRQKRFFDDDRQLLLDSEWFERQLSLQLTVLRNSMLVHKQMSSCAVKHWVNGAAFHTQRMLLHTARLRKKIGPGTDGFENAKIAAGNAADSYHRDMVEILKQYREYMKPTFASDLYQHCLHFGYCPGFCAFSTDKRNVLKPKHRFTTVDELLNYIASHHQKFKEVQNYFSNLQTNLNVLANQEGVFKAV
ncbi:uncharacterized protein LOC134448874 [Engraulis encrasicolus]|uniref:uncharacterized protein LOC134448874 n=1 Tax=Engraulis encrasicolus TaxID=184585 RepID=UPI002FD36E52